jgi:DNA polymerase III delta subunit
MVCGLRKCRRSLQLPVIDAHTLPDWLSGRLQQAGLRTEDAEAFALLRERVEGNLLAAQQEIEKLRLLADNGILTTDIIRKCRGRQRPLQRLRSGRLRP